MKISEVTCHKMFSLLSVLNYQLHSPFFSFPLLHFYFQTFSHEIEFFRQNFLSLNFTFRPHSSLCLGIFCFLYNCAWVQPTPFSPARSSLKFVSQLKGRHFRLIKKSFYLSPGEKFLAKNKFSRKYLRSKRMTGIVTKSIKRFGLFNLGKCWSMMSRGCFLKHE